MNSDEDRTAKKLIQHQKECSIEESWYGELMRVGKKYEIELNNNNMIKTKSKWKQYVKDKIRHKITAESEEKKNSMTKLRHQKQQEFCMQQYIKETSITRIQDLLRVNMRGESSTDKQMTDQQTDILLSTWLRPPSQVNPPSS